MLIMPFVAFKGIVYVIYKYIGKENVKGKHSNYGDQENQENPSKINDEQG